MLKTIIKKYILDITENNVSFDHNLSRYTSFGIGGAADALIFPRTAREIIKIAKSIETLGIPLTVLGGGSNVLIKDQGLRGIVMMLSNYEVKTKTLEKKNKLNILKIASGVSVRDICKFSIKNGLAGTNFALGIPGTIGGAIAMNSGTTKGCILDILESITILNRANKVVKMTIPPNSIYSKHWLNRVKSSIVLECKIKLIESNCKSIRDDARDTLIKRKNTQPTNSASAGCFFKNPKVGFSAGELIDKIGLKGKQIGEAIISEKHANFIVNKNKATATDVLKLADLVQKSVYKHFQVRLEPEVCILGN